MMRDREPWVNGFAIRSFRDIADGDYIAARMACRAELLPQYLWASQQAIEKYLKCILLLQRIPAPKVRDNLAAALQKIEESGKLAMDLSAPTRAFVAYIDDYGPYRYMEVSHWGEGRDILKLDRAVFELRQHCTPEDTPRHKVTEGVMPPKIRLRGGYLEKIIDSKRKSANTARAALLWQNAFFGTKTRRFVRIGGWVQSSSSPLSMTPELIDHVKQYVYLPKDLIAWCTNEAQKKRP